MLSHSYDGTRKDKENFSVLRQHPEVHQKTTASPGKTPFRKNIKLRHLNRQKSQTNPNESKKKNPRKPSGILSPLYIRGIERWNHEVYCQGYAG